MSHLVPRLLVSPSGMTQSVGLEELRGSPGAVPVKWLVHTTLRQTVPWE